MQLSYQKQNFQLAKGAFLSGPKGVILVCFIQPLDVSHLYQVLHLVELTKPGFFLSGRLAFGNYFGIFDDGKLVSMAGQRFQVEIMMNETTPFRRKAGNVMLALNDLQTAIASTE